MSDAVWKSYRFEQRAELYADWDRQLRAKTRFFAAACLTNRVLGVLARMAFPVRLSAGAVELLEKLGASLEPGNRSLAMRVRAGKRSGALLDAWMVQIEQRRVESFLDGWGALRPTTVRRVTAELDGVLNWNVPCSLCCNLLPSLSGYLGVLRLVRSEIGPRIEFARQAHRVRIGQELIEGIRDGEIAAQ
jgi:hypothetical protein